LTSPTRTISLVVATATALTAAALFAQGRLDQLRQSIRDSQEKLKRLEGQSRQSTASIAEYRRQATALDTLVADLEGREQRLAAQMIAARATRDSLSDERAILRAQYSAMARALFKHRLLTTSASVLLLPKEHEELALRQRLFERYARVQQDRADRIGSLTASLAVHDSLLRRRQQEQLAVIGEKRSEMERLFDLQRSQTASLGQTAAEQTALKAQIDRQNAEAQQISGMIARLANQDDQKQQAERARRQLADRARQSTPSRTEPERPAVNNRPRADAEPVRPQVRQRSGPVSFTWPTSGRKIVEGYGERTNPETGTVTINPGINIAASSGSSAVASEDGVVSLVSWLPSYGTIVIVEHRDGYRTVYGNLAGASVSRGSSVGSGQRLGTVGGGSLHFEIWRGQTRLDPAAVLR
jgi:septal ring factor EnvC (AmiA/AmiB activator)